MAKAKAFKISDLEYAKAFNAGDAKKVAALYTKDALVLMPQTPPYKGRNGVKEQVKAMRDIGWRNIKFKTIRSGKDGGLAFNIGTVTVDRKDGDRTEKLKGKYLDIYKRQSDGSWEIITTMYNDDAPAK